MAVKERGRERGAISRRMLEERERGWGGGVGNSKKEEGGRRKEMDKDKTVRRGVEEKANKNLFFVTLHFLFTQIQTKKRLFARLRTPVHSHTR